MAVVVDLFFSEGWHRLTGNTSPTLPEAIPLVIVVALIQHFVARQYRR
jgi:hypothetical protein